MGCWLGTERCCALRRRVHVQLRGCLPGKQRLVTCTADTLLCCATSPTLCCAVLCCAVLWYGKQLTFYSLASKSPEIVQCC